MDTKSTKYMNVTFTVKSKDEGSMEDVIIRSHSSVAAD